MIGNIWEKTVFANIIKEIEMPFGFRRGKGRDRRGFHGSRGIAGSELDKFPTNCVCPNCGLIIPHKQGTPCFKIKCPRCNSPMARQFFR